MEFERSINSKHQLNLTPLIDIIFLLIVFFMLTSKFALNESINLSIATASIGEEVVKDDESILILLHPDNRYTLDGNTHDISHLKHQLPDLLGAGNNEKNIFLLPKGNVTLQTIVSAMDYIQRLGGKNVTLADESNAK